VITHHGFAVKNLFLSFPIRVHPRNPWLKLPSLRAFVPLWFRTLDSGHVSRITSLFIAACDEISASVFVALRAFLWPKSGAEYIPGLIHPLKNIS
jgi:hypothetical protein